MELSETLPQSFLEGKTPEAWCNLLADLHGIKLSPRSLRSMARETGNLSPIGRDMLLSPHHIDKILEAVACRSNSTKEMKSIGSKGGSMNYRTVDTTDKALTNLRKQAR